MKTQLLTLLLLTGIVNAQVYINVEDGKENPSAILQVDSDHMGFQFPVIKLTSEKPNLDHFISEPAKGSLVFVESPEGNASQSGFYVYNSYGWNYIGRIEKTLIQSIENNEFLGYETEVKSTSLSVSNIPAGNIELGCKKWTDGNQHTYCLYQSSNYLTWEKAYENSKVQKGYLVTITSNAEFDFLREKLFTSYTNVQNVWVGYSRYKLKEVSSSENNNQFRWVTGEDFQISWANSVNEGAVVELKDKFTSFDNQVNSSTSKNCAKLVKANHSFSFQADNCATSLTNYYIVEYP